MEALKTFETLTESEKIIFFEKVLNSLSPTKEQKTTNAKPNISFIETVANSIKKTSVENLEKSPIPNKGQKTLDYWLIKRSTSSNINNDRLASTSNADEILKGDDKGKSSVPSRKRSLAVPTSDDKKSDVLLDKNKRSKFSLNTHEESTSPSVGNKKSAVSPIIDKSTSVSPNIHNKLTVSPVTNRRSSVSPINKKALTVPSIVENVSSISVNSKQSTTSPIKNVSSTLSSIVSEKAGVSGGGEASYNLRSKRKSSNSGLSDATTTKNVVTSDLSKLKKDKISASSRFSEDLSQTGETTISSISDSLVTNSSSSFSLIANSKILKNTQNTVDYSNYLQNSSNAEYEAYCKLKLEFSQHGLDIKDILKDERIQNFLESIDENSPVEDSLVLIDTYKNDSGVIVPIIHTHESLSMLTKKLLEMQKQFKEKPN